MTLPAGTYLGSYEVLAPIGAGGMGEVYRARDTRLKRNVAIKVLPESLSHDPDRLARFQREAELLATLNHPNIAAVYGLEKADGLTGIVLELVEGDTLADLIAHGPIPLGDALPMARQIADAMEAAHEKGIIHRDLKPANVKVTADGRVKVLDFGLAKMLDTETAASTLTMSPTLSVRATYAGILLGTAPYMSPEQARGKPVDKRTDIWAFGCVLYEMLSGTRAFGEEDVTDTLAAIVRADPDWGRLPNDTSPGIRRLLRRCLEKDRKRRLSDIADARLEIDDALNAPPTEIPMALAARWRSGERLAWVSALAVVTVIAVAPSLWTRRPMPPAPEIRTEINTPATTDPVSFALSPDGRQLVFVASGDGPPRLWLRSLAATSAQPLAGTDGALYPFWSPDSRSVAFFADGKLKRLDMGTGQPQTLTNAVARAGGAWNADGIMLYAPTAGSPLFRVTASGGQPAAVTRLDSQSSHRFPAFLPDGHHFFFYAQGTPDTSGIYLGSLDSPDMTRLTPADTAGAYLPSGWLAWVRDGTLVAQRFDLTHGTLAGDLVTVADPVAFDAGVYAGAFSVSGTGLMAYRSGKALGVLGLPDQNGLAAPRLSPDGRRVAAFRTVQGNADLWLLDGTRTIRLTFDTALDRYPIWSPNGNQIVFDSNRTGTRNLFLTSSSNAGTEKLLLDTPQSKTATDWSADGRFILYVSPARGDLWVLPMEGDRKSWPFLKSGFSKQHGQFSPDGRWVAYMSNESGRMEVYVRPFVDPASPPSTGGPAGGQWQVSTAGGIYPRWRPDGKELYYIAPDAQLMATPMPATATTMEPGTPVALFQTHMYGGGTDNAQGRQYDVARDGRFLINRVLDDVAPPITLLQNWTPPTGK